MKKIIVSLGILLIFILLFGIWFLKFPISWKSQAYYYGMKTLENETGVDLFNTNENFMVEQLNQDTWVFMNEQVYHPIPGMMGGECYVVFDKNRTVIEVRIGELTYDAFGKTKQGSYLERYGY